MSTIQKKSVLRHLLRAPVYLYRWRLGALFGKRFLLLTHTGRRTGVHHQTVLEVMEYREEGPEAVVMSGFGRNSDWLRDIETTSNEEVLVGLGWPYSGSDDDRLRLVKQLPLIAFRPRS